MFSLIRARRPLALATLLGSLLTIATTALALADGGGPVLPR